MARATDPTGPEATGVTEVDDASIGPDGLRRQLLFELRFVSAPSLEPVVDAVLAWPRSADPDALPALVTPNVDIMVQLADDSPPEATAVFESAQFVLPDGMPIVASSRLLGRPLPSRLPGSGLFEILWPRLAVDRRPTVMACANEGIGRQLQSEHPGLRYTVPPLFDHDDDGAVGAVVDQILAAAGGGSTDYVLLGMGHPKDAVLIARLCETWPSDSHRPLFCGLGGSFGMYVGQTKRAPEWMQRTGLEWFYRFAQEPRRLFHRYFIRDAGFVKIVAAEYRRTRS